MILPSAFDMSDLELLYLTGHYWNVAERRHFDDVRSARDGDLWDLDSDQPPVHLRRGQRDGPGRRLVDPGVGMVRAAAGARSAVWLHRGGARADRLALRLARRQLSAADPRPDRGQSRGGPGRPRVGHRLR